MPNLPTNLPHEGAPVSFKTAILPLFRPMDIQCMRGRSVFLADYHFMSAKNAGGIFANANNVLAYLKGEIEPRMPFGGPYWSDHSIALFQSWIDGGCKP